MRTFSIFMEGRKVAVLDVPRDDPPVRPEVDYVWLDHGQKPYHHRVQKVEGDAIHLYPQGIKGGEMSEDDIRKGCGLFIARVL